MNFDSFNSLSFDSIVSFGASAEWRAQTLLSSVQNAQFKQKQLKVKMREMNYKWLKMSNIS